VLDDYGSQRANKLRCCFNWQLSTIFTFI